MNILFKADLSKYVAHRPSVLYWVLQPGADVGGIGMGLVRMVRPWNEWLIVWGYDINEPARRRWTRPSPPRWRATWSAIPISTIEIQSVSTWTVNNMYADATCRRAACSAWATRPTAIRRRTDSAPTPRSRTPSTSPGSSPMVLKGQAGPKLLDSYDAERAPIAKQIVTRANKSIEEFGPIFKALGLLDSIDPVKMQAEHGRALRRHARRPRRSAPAIREAIAFKVYEFDAHGVEMNQRYNSDAIVTDGSPSRLRQGRGTALPADHLARRAPAACLAVRPRRREGLDARPRRPGPLRAVHRHRRRGLGRGRRRRSARNSASTIAAYVIGPRQDWQDLRRRLGECPRGARQRHRAGPARPACRAGGARPSPPIRPANCAASSTSILGQVRIVMARAREGLLHRGELRRGGHRPQRQRQGRAAEGR